MIIDTNLIRKIYFVGIGGIAMSAAAGLCKDRNFEVTGSDSKELYAPAKDILESAEIEYFTGYSAENVEKSDADLFVISAGEDQSNPEVKYILENKLAYASFPELLYELAKEDLRIVVTGTHGKSTTSGLLGYVLKNIDDSSFVAGAVLKNLLSNYHSGRGNYFVFEGDEYKAMFNDPTPKFHFYKPDIAVLTNLEFDHPDLFANLDDTKNELALMLTDMPDDGLIIYNSDSNHLTDLVYRYETASFSFGVHNEADFKAENIKYSPLGTEFDVVRAGQTELPPEHYEITLPGEINVYNTMGVIATLRSLGFSQEVIAPLLASYTGLKRRFEIVSDSKGILVVDDYAHHPTAIRETLAAAKAAYPEKRIWAVFEPHTFSRTQALLPELSESFENADRAIIAEIYPAREKAKDHNISTDDLIKQIQSRNSKFEIHNSIWKAGNKAEALKILKENVKSGDIVIVMAVGDFNRLAYDLADLLNAN